MKQVVARKFSIIMHIGLDIHAALLPVDTEMHGLMRQCHYLL